MGARRTRLLLAILAGAVAVVAKAACGGSEAEGADDPTTVTVGMLDNTFTRDVTRVDVGDTVVFRNDGETIHNAVDAEGRGAPRT